MNAFIRRSIIAVVLLVGLLSFCYQLIFGEKESELALEL